MLDAIENVSVINVIKHYQHIMMNVTSIFIIKHHECTMNLLLNVSVMIAIKCFQYVINMIVNGLIMVSITINMWKRQPLHKNPLGANNVAISRRQPMHRSHSHLPPPHPCTSFAEMPLETTNISFSREQTLPHPLNI